MNGALAQTLPPSDLLGLWLESYRMKFIWVSQISRLHPQNPRH